MIKKILIANRGEIACRVIRTAKKMDIATVAVYSDADKQALHVKSADEAVYIGAAPSSESYLNQEKIIEAAKSRGADAIHPGYGFLSENADFAERCEKEGITFIGPRSHSIRSMGSKSAAKRIMENAHVPLVPGYHGEDQSVEVLKRAAIDMGFPVLLKAVAGGGGRGMRPVFAEEEFERVLVEAKREAKNSFGNDVMLVEKYLPRARHVEVQVFCDQHGNAVFLGDRDCSVQRRHQKVVEEAPAPGLSPALRSAMGLAAVRAAQAIDYVGAGTVEFLLDANRANDEGDVSLSAEPDSSQFYFMEMNTRLQVEHPVTEYISGVDLVAWQINVANGERLTLSQEEITLQGHAMEVRLYAENPYQEFRPSTGTISHLTFAPEDLATRIDTGFESGDAVSPYYDAMLAKVITYADTREKAIEKLLRALNLCKIAGVYTNLDWLKTVIAHPQFVAAQLYTNFLADNPGLMDEAEHNKHLKQNVNVALCWFFCIAKKLFDRQQSGFSMAERSLKTQSGGLTPWQRLHAWRLNQSAHMGAEFILAGEQFSLSAPVDTTNSHHHEAQTVIDSTLVIGNERYHLEGVWDGEILSVTCNEQDFRFPVVALDAIVETANQTASKYCLLTPALAVELQITPADHGEGDAEEGDASYLAPMNARVIEIMVEEGSDVVKGQALLVLEAMKMEYTISAKQDGVVEKIMYPAGALVEAGADLLTLGSQ